MFLKLLCESPQALALVHEAQSLLYNAGYFPAAYELGLLRVGSALQQSTETAAIQKGFIEGYTAAIQDLLHFQEKFGQPVHRETSNVVPDYGALDRLLATQQITREEYDSLRKRQRERFHHD